MLHRGPDGEGSWLEHNVALTHRRLAVIDPTEAGAQPMVSADGRWVLVYNGELYNNTELRGELRLTGRSFRTHCDTEAVVEAFAAYGTEALGKLRGMFALAAYDRVDKRMILARDPLGVKPLYWSEAGGELVFSSEIKALLRHPKVEPQPDWFGVSGYLTTLASSRGQRTLFEGVQMLQPGTALVCESGAGKLTIRQERFFHGKAVDTELTWDEAVERLGHSLKDSVQRQLVSDVPLCTLLSGGIDSAAIAALALEQRSSLWSYAAGSREHDTDLVAAADLSTELGTEHHVAHVEKDSFLELWNSLLQSYGLPLSTPNEVAIHSVSRKLRADGCVVTLSGEGSDELLAGYESVMRAARTYEQNPPPGMCGGRFLLEASAWIPSAQKAQLLNRDIWNELDGDRALITEVVETFRSGKEEAGSEADPLEAHLRFLQRYNLPVLLERLDRATMLASVEGRVPFADSEVLSVCHSLPMDFKLGEPDPERPTSKRILRHLCRGKLPEQVLTRPKTSFPLPFEKWMGSLQRSLAHSPFARRLLSREALAELSSTSAPPWQIVWPLLNIASWGDYWFEGGAGASSSPVLSEVAK